MEIVFPTLVWLRPLWLFLLIPLVLLAPWLWRGTLRATQQTQIIATHLTQHLVKTQGKQITWIRPLSLLLAAFICVVALAGPAVQKIEIPTFTADRGAVLLFDASLETRAQDIAPDRHTRLRFKAIDLVTQFTEGHLGLVAYAGEAFTVTPLTHDSRTILQSLRVLEPELMPSAGNDPLLGFEEASRLLQAAGYREGDIFWFTAGIQERDIAELRRHLRDKNWRIHVLAVGTSDGAPIRNAEGEFIRDLQGRIMLPRLIPEYLQTFTRMTGGTFETYTQDNQDIENLLAAAQRSQTDFIEALERGDSWHDLGPWIALFLIPFALHAARRGVLYLFPMMLIPFFFTAPTTAFASVEDDALPNRAQLSLLERFLLTRDQQAQRLQTAGDYTSAASTFASEAHRASALYRSAQYPEAAASFSGLPGADARFNQGNALARMGALQEALDAYTKALEERPGWREAEENYALVQKLLAEQPPQQGNDEQGQDHDRSDENDTSESTHDESAKEDTEQQNMAEEPQDTNASDDSDSEQSPADMHNEPTTDETDADHTEPESASPAPEYQDLTQEELDELNQLLRRVDEDPALILRNRLQREAQRRRNQTQPPRGF